MLDVIRRILDIYFLTHSYQSEPIPMEVISRRHLPIHFSAGKHLYDQRHDDLIPLLALSEQRFYHHNIVAHADVFGKSPL